MHEIEIELKGLFSLIAQARRVYFHGQKTKESRDHLESLEAKARELHKEFGLLLHKAQTHLAYIPGREYPLLPKSLYESIADEQCQ